MRCAGVLLAVLLLASCSSDEAGPSCGEMAEDLQAYADEAIEEGPGYVEGPAERELAAAYEEAGCPAP